MHTLDIKKIYKKTLVAYILSTIICIIFAFIYNLYGRGVTSVYMTFSFVYSAVLGVLVYFLLYKFWLVYNRVAYNIYNAAIATLTTGSILKGILYISGVGSKYPKYYFELGFFLIIISIIIFIITLTKNRNKKSK